MTREDKDNLLNEGIDKALFFLEKNSEFYPFGICLNLHKGLIHLSTYTGDEHPPSEDVIEELTKCLKNGINNDEYLAVSIVSDVKLKDSQASKVSDAIRIDIEHKESNPITCFLPYIINDEGQIETGDICAIPRTPGFFK